MSAGQTPESKTKLPVSVVVTDKATEAAKDIEKDKPIKEKGKQQSEPIKTPAPTTQTMQTTQATQTTQTEIAKPDEQSTATAKSETQILTEIVMLTDTQNETDAQSQTETDPYVLLPSREGYLYSWAWFGTFKKKEEAGIFDNLSKRTLHRAVCVLPANTEYGPARAIDYEYKPVQRGNFAVLPDSLPKDKALAFADVIEVKTQDGDGKERDTDTDSKGKQVFTPLPETSQRTKWQRANLSKRCVLLPINDAELTALEQNLGLCLKSAML